MSLDEGGLDPGSWAARVALARRLQREHQPEAAARVYLEAIDASPTLANCLIAADRLDALATADTGQGPTRSIRIALLGNATLDHLKSYVKVECYRAGLRPVVYQAGYDQYAHAILDKDSELYRFDPEVVICAVHASRLFPNLHEYPFDMPVEARRAELEAGLQTVQQLLDTLSERSSALVLFHNMVAPQYPALGVLDLRDEFGQMDAFSQINSRLAELARTRYRNVYIVDEDRVQAHCGKNSATDQRHWLTARMPWSEPVLAELSREYMRYVRAARGLARKCIVVDLDNTLWGGVIGEDGLQGIRLGSEAPGNAFVAFQRQLERLWRRGVLLAICSKNNPEDALAVFERHPEMVLKLSHFAARRINWQPKPDNIREIAQELNIGLDSLVFLDDNPVERAAVRMALPQVLTPELPLDPASYRPILLEIGAMFDTLALTQEDRDRNRLYAEQAARREAEVELSTGGSMGAYLASLQMVVEVEPVDSISLPRVAQLTNKTNQFNLTTRRYTEGDIVAKQAGGSRVFSARVRDRFGDNGLTGVAILEPASDDVWSIDTFLLSCRVMGRGVETAILRVMAEEARRAGGRCLQGWYVPTPKNSVVRDCYEQHGFQHVQSSEDGAALWALDLSNQAIETPAWLTLRTSADTVMSA